LDALGSKMISLKEGQKSPDFELPDSEGKKVKLSDFRGKKVVLYFYPKDNTPGCTRQACDLRDNVSKLRKKGAVVLGVSCDSTESHRKFSEKYSLPFKLLADTEKDVAKKYGVYGIKKFLGKEYMGITRSTFIISAEGKIEKILYKVNPQKHMEELLPLLE
jgi:thioredoxin-dependent peroxiredoxin